MIYASRYVRVVPSEKLFPDVYTWLRAAKCPVNVEYIIKKLLRNFEGQSGSTFKKL